MTTDTAVVERALVLMAIAMSVQTLLFIAAGVALVIAWRRTTDALADARDHLNRISATVDEAADAFMRGSSAIDGMASDVRDVVGTVRNSVGSVASIVTAPRAALALGVWRGIQIWRKRRAAHRLAAAATSEV